MILNIFSTPRTRSPPRKGPKEELSRDAKPEVLVESLKQLAMAQESANTPPNGSSLNMLPPLQDAKLSQEKKPESQKSAPVIVTKAPPASITPKTSEPVLPTSNGRVIDDIPPTPKKPIGVLDPRRYASCKLM